MSFSDPRPYSPETDDPVAIRARTAAQVARSSLGPGYDWLIELLRQILSRPPWRSSLATER